MTDPAQRERAALDVLELLPYRWALGPTSYKDRGGLGGADHDDAQAQKLQRWVDREKEWLSAHPSDSCYAGTYAPWSRGVNSYGEYARLIHEGIAEGDQTKLNQADTTNAFAEMKKGQGTISVSNDACMP